MDHDGDIVSPRAMASEIKRWLGSFPAVRVQHRGDHPAGKGLEAWQDPDGSTWLRALVVDSAAVKMVKRQVLRAFSVGLTDVQTKKSPRAPRYEIVGFRLTEVSLVDSPSNARCGIEVCKSVGGQPVYSGTVYRVTKSGKVKVTKGGKRASAGLLADPDDVMGWLLNSSDPFTQEAARGLVRRNGLHV